MRKRLMDIISRADFEPVKGVRVTIGSRFTELFIGGIADRLIKDGVVIPVRCEDCINYKEVLGIDSGKPCGYGRCKNPCAMVGIVYNDDFCSYGVRKENGGNG